MAQVCSDKIMRCDGMLTWRDFIAMTAGIMKMLMPYEQKQNFKKNFLCLKTKKKF